MSEELNNLLGKTVTVQRFGDICFSMTGKLRLSASGKYMVYGATMLQGYIAFESSMVVKIKLDAAIWPDITLN